jgi:hypothetical protein
MTDRLLDVQQAARRLKRCPETIRRYIRRGILKAGRPPIPGAKGGNYLIAETELARFLATSRDMSSQNHQP